MATLSAKKVTDALKKAQNVGQVEEPVIIDGCEVVLRSLRSDEYEAVHTDTQEFEEIAYLNAFKREHLCRSIIEVNEVDLRAIDLIEVEVEEEDPKTRKPVIKTVKVERHAFVRDYVIATWSREAIDVAFRKFNDVVAKAEKKAGDGVIFIVPDETAEDKYRRLLLEAKAVEGSVPIELGAKIREDLGFAIKTSPADYAAVEDRLSKLSTEVDSSEPEVTPEPVAAPEPAVTPEPEEEAPEAPREAPIRPQRVPPRAAVSKPSEEAQVPLVRPARPVIPAGDGLSPEALMQARQPLNQRAVEVPLPSPVEVPGPSAALQANPILPPTQAALRRAAEIAAMEGELAAPGPSVQGGTTSFTSATPEGPMELSRQQTKINPGEVERIFDQPPVAGINPRFRAPPRV